MSEKYFCMALELIDPTKLQTPNSNTITEKLLECCNKSLTLFVEFLKWKNT